MAAEARYVYTTPKSYLELLKLFTSLLEKKHVEADAAIQRLEGGVLKLAESAEAVANLEENLKVIFGAALCLDESRRPEMRGGPIVCYIPCMWGFAWNLMNDFEQARGGDKKHILQFS